MENKKEYKVFISYSWTTKEHENWVVDFATRLMNDGIEVKLDKWDLKEGHDKHVFMESMVSDDTIDKVLVICEKGYKEKADKRTGGAGIETEIIAPELYNKAKQTKFIPIVKESIDDNFEAYMPIYFRNRIAIDFTSLIRFEDEYDKLLRLIVDKPLYRKPVKGTLPTYLFEDQKQHYKTSSIVKQLKDIFLANPDRVQYYIMDFLDEFKNYLGGFQIEDSDIEEGMFLDEKILSLINEMTKLRDDYIGFLSIILKYDIPLDIEKIKSLFELLYYYSTLQKNGRNYRELSDHYKFFTLELFLYTISLFMKNEKYESVYYLTHCVYFVNDGLLSGDLKEINYIHFNFYIRSIEEQRKTRLKSNKYTLATDLLIERSHSIKGEDFGDLVMDVDLLLYYIYQTFESNKSEFTNRYFPRTFIYSQGRKNKFLQKISSSEYFSKIKILFSVSSKEEMKIFINKNLEEMDCYYNSVPNMKRHIDPDLISKSM